MASFILRLLLLLAVACEGRHSSLRLTPSTSFQSKPPVDTSRNLPQAPFSAADPDKTTRNQHQHGLPYRNIERSWKGRSKLQDERHPMPKTSLLPADTTPPADSTSTETASTTPITISIPYIPSGQPPSPRSSQTSFAGASVVLPAQATPPEDRSAENATESTTTIQQSLIKIDSIVEVAEASRRRRQRQRRLSTVKEQSWQTSSYFQGQSATSRTGKEQGWQMSSYFQRMFSYFQGQSATSRTGKEQSWQTSSYFQRMFSYFQGQQQLQTGKELGRRRQLRVGNSLRMELLVDSSLNGIASYEEQTAVAANVQQASSS
eukprot:gene375-1764_t